MNELRECREEFEKYRDYEEIDEFFLNLSKNEYLRAKADGDNEEVAMMDASGIHAFYHGWIARGKINTPKHETVEEWETRTGETYPDDGPVWLTIDSELWVTGWQLMTKEYWLLYNNDEQAIVYIANHHGKPEIEE